MTVVLKRTITSEMMTTYFPSLLLTAITFATTFFKPFFFEAALGVNLTTMLVMTTIFISKMEGLPPTSDIKMIDIWLVLCQMVPFVEVVLLTAMEYQRDELSSDETDRERVAVASFSDGKQDKKEIDKDIQSWTPNTSKIRVPSLKSVGWLKNCNKKKGNEGEVLINDFSERVALPSLVLGSYIVYFVLAALFYHDGF